MNYQTVNYKTEHSLVDPNVTRKVLTEKYTVRKQEFNEMVEKTETPVLPYIYISPNENLGSSKYPHSKKRRLPDYGINDKIFRNGNSSVGLGYYSIQ